MVRLNARRNHQLKRLTLAQLWKAVVVLHLHCAFRAVGIVRLVEVALDIAEPLFQFGELGFEPSARLGGIGHRAISSAGTQLP